MSFNLLERGKYALIWPMSEDVKGVGGVTLFQKIFHDVVKLSLILIGRS